MNRVQLAHVLRAAARVAGDEHILVLGSQAILATHDAGDLPESVTLSMEVDVAFFEDDGEVKSDIVDGALGEGSMFHQEFGYYGQGVSVSTAVLPTGWEGRLVGFAPLDSQPADAVCLDLVDLIVAKLVAGREKDLAFASDLLAAGHVDATELRERAELLQVVGAVRRRVVGHIDRLARRLR